MRSLLLGCGNSRERKIKIDGAEWKGELTTLDINPKCGADILFDLDKLSWGVRADALHGFPVLPIADGEFDELAAYDVLEHFGRQGDWRGWFAEMAEYHRILKPGGVFGIIVPIGQDALADPGHTRFFHPNHFFMLCQAWYRETLGKGLQVTDYRWYWTLNFDVEHCEDVGGHHLAVVLRKA